MNNEQVLEHVTNENIVEQITKKVLKSKIIQNKERIDHIKNQKKIHTNKPIKTVTTDKPKKKIPKIKVSSTIEMVKQIDLKKNGGYEKICKLFMTTFKNQQYISKKEIMDACIDSYQKKIKIQQWSWAQDAPNKPAIIFKDDPNGKKLRQGTYRNKFYEPE